MFRTFPMLVLAITALFSAAIPASAQNERQTERVSYVDLDLNNPAGAAVFERRVRQAIARVCDTGVDHSISTLLEQDRCASQARAEVKLQMTQAYAATGRLSSASLTVGSHSAGHTSRP